MLEVTAAVIRSGARFLLCQRPAGKSNGLLWEFPGGKQEQGETLPECIRRECMEELGIVVDPTAVLAEATHAAPGGVIHLTFFLCEIQSGKLTRKEHAAFAWVTRAEAARYPLCPGDASMLAALPEGLL